MTLELTEEELNVLKNIAGHLSETYNWIEKEENPIVTGEVLMHKEELNIELIKRLYDKLFE